jgi:alkane 1-monooxygenase
MSSRGGPQSALAASEASVLDYLKFFLFHAVGLLSLVALVAGGPAITAGLLAVLLIYVLGDAVCGDDTSTPQYRRPQILTIQLWAALPLLALIVFAAVWGVSPGDPLGFGAWVTQWAGVDVLAAKHAAGLAHHVAAVILTGLMIGMTGTITGHELTHRTCDRVSMLIGRWLLAFSFDTVFSIEHVYGHHRYVSTAEDPATAPRGRNVYVHIVASTIKGNLSAWRIECQRLRRRGHAVFSWHNAVIRGHLMSVALVALAWAIGGWTAALFFMLCALWGKALLEIVNYMEHYGMVRDPATPVQPRHSWNSNRRISSWSMFNLTRHSHHHAQGEVPYQDLKPISEAPMMVGGYLTTVLVAMVPPLWHWLMTPKVLEWDRTYASDAERVLAARANERSGIGNDHLKGARGGPSAARCATSLAVQPLEPARWQPACTRVPRWDGLPRRQ